MTPGAAGTASYRTRGETVAQDETDAAARLAEALTQAGCPWPSSRLLAAALLPVVRELGDLRAAEAVRRAFIDAADEAIHLGRRGPNAIGDWLLDYGQNRTATLRGEAGR